VKLAIRRRRPRAAQRELVEIVTPRTNAASITAAENLLASVSRSEPFGLEIAATRDIRWFIARAESPAMRLHLEQQLASVYPQAEMRRLDTVRHPNLDPARCGPGERVLATALVLGAPQYLPLRIFHDADVAPARTPQADPVLGILGALNDLPQGWRALAQVVLHPAPDRWSEGYLRLAVEHPLADERVSELTQAIDPGMIGLLALMAIGGLSFQGYHWYSSGEWLRLGLLTTGGAAGVPGFFWLASRLTRRPIYDMKLVQEKVSRIAYITQLRLAVFAPEEVAQPQMVEQLRRLIVAYRQFNLAAGNAFKPRQLAINSDELACLQPILPARSLPVLNTRELAGLWHLPQGQADIPFVERTTARQRLPLPFTVARGCRIGVASHQGRDVPVALPDELLRRHLLLVAKTRRGKSTLLLRMAVHLMKSRGVGRERPAVVVIDPHRDLAEAALGSVPDHRRDEVVYLNVAERERPFGLNLIDVGLGWDTEKAVANALTIFKRQFDRFWGPRMEDAFRFALLTLMEANQTICAADPDGRSRQHTIFEVPPLFTSPPFRRTVLPLVRDPSVRAWWPTYFDSLDRRLQLDIVNPVLTKVQRFLGSRTARAIVGQPRSTIDPSRWVRFGNVVIVNTAKGSVGEDTAALIGATLLNLVALAVEEQSQLDVESRRGVRLLVDEFHTMPGADYETVVGELAKYGGNLVLATQSLASLEVLDRTQDRALRAKLFSNIDGLFVFQTSAEDARYLVPELGDGVDVQDLISLPDHQCYVRVNARGETLPTFSVRLDPPPDSDAAIHAALAAASAARYGRARAAVERDLELALSRIERLRQGAGQPRAGAETGGGAERDGGTGGQVRPPDRNKNRQPRNAGSGKKPGNEGARPRKQLPLPDAPNFETPDPEADPSAPKEVVGERSAEGEEGAA
jgi:hypothetical protein